MVCSEFTARFIEHVLQMDIPDELDIVGPKGILDFVKKNPQIFKPVA